MGSKGRRALLSVVLLGLGLVWLWLRPRAPAAAPPAWVAALRTGDVLRAPAGHPSRKLTLAGETRNAILAGPSISARLPPAHASRLEVAAGLRCAEGTACRGTVSFEVRVDTPAGSAVLTRFRLEADWLEDHPEALPLKGRATEWHVERLGLPETGERELQLTLLAEPQGDVSGDLQAFWSEPLLLAAAPERTNLLLVSIDTLRADHLGCYGYARDTSPNLDRLARDGLRFEETVAQAPWTTPSHMSLLTGLYPSTHGVTSRPTATPVRRLAGGVPTLAALLRRHGYQTRAYTGGGTMGESFGFDRGFDVYHDGPLKLTPRARDEMRDLLRGLGSTPFFLYLHTFEVHAPYTRTRYVEDRLTARAREDWSARFDLEWLPRPAQRAFAEDAPLVGEAGRLTPELRARRLALKELGVPALLERHGLWDARSASDLYDGGVREADGFVGELLAELQRLGLDDRTVVAVTSDHGEEFGEHDPERFWDAHCSTLYEELLRVPLILRLPSGPRGVVRDQVQLVDVAPTLLEALGQEVPETMQGRSLLALARGEAHGDPWAFSEATCDGPERKALRRPDLKLIAELEPGAGPAGGAPEIRHLQLFHLPSDPGERRDRSVSDVHDTERLRAELLDVLAELRGAATPGDDQQLGSDELERLRALGYIH